MMNDNWLLITFASWEDRFRLGFVRDLGRVEVRKVLVFYFDGYVERTRESRDAVNSVCEKREIGLESRSLDVEDAARSWRTVVRSIEEMTHECRGVLVDISTMPREVIWYVLWLVEKKTLDLRYVYHSPKDYGKDWLSRDPRSPRLVYKLSGIALPSKKTALLVTAGFDLQRAMRLIHWCEPGVLLVGLQSQSRFARNSEAMDSYREEIGKEHDCTFFEVDAFADDRGLAAIQEQVAKLGPSCNVIMSSLGPKLTALTLYRLQRAQQEFGLVYAPSTQFSDNYSVGIGEGFWGAL